MAHYDEDDGREDFGESYGSSHAPSRDFASIKSDMKADGKKRVGPFLMPASLAATIAPVYAALAGTAGNYMQKFSAPFFERMAGRLGMAGSEAARFRSRAALGVGIATTFSKPLTGIAGSLYSAAMHMRELHDVIAPIAEANGDNPYVSLMASSTNDVFQDGQNDIWRRVFRESQSELINALPLMLHFGALREKAAETSAKFSKEEKYKRFATLSADEQVALMEEEMGISLGGKRKGGPDSLEKVSLSDLLDVAKQRFAARHKEFVAENKAKIEARLKDEIGFRQGIGEDLLASQEDARRRYGLPVAKPNPMNFGSSGDTYDRQELQRRDFNKAVDRAVTNLVDAEFVKAHGAFDQEWAEKGRFGRNKLGYDDQSRDKDAPKTIRQTIEEGWKEYKGLTQEGRGKLGKDEEKQLRASMEKILPGVGAFASQYLDYLLTGEDSAKKPQPVALDYIIHLRDLSEQTKNGDFPDRVPPKNENGVTIGGGSLSRFLLDMVQARMSRSPNKGEIQESYFTNLAHVQFDDKQFLDIPREKLSEFEVIIAELVKHIAKERDMDVAALANILGDNDHGLKLIRGNGDFGPPGFTGTEEQKKDAIVAAIDAQAKLMRRHVELTQGEKNKEIGTLGLDAEAVKKVFAGSDKAQQGFLLKSIERFLPEEKDICEFTGMKPELCKSLRDARDNDKEDQLLSAAVQVASERLEEGDEEWKKQGMRPLNDREKKAVQRMGEEASQGKDVVDAASGAELKAAAAVAAVLAMTGDGWKAIQERCEECAKEAEAKQKEAAEEKAAAGGSFSERHRKKKRGGKQHDEEGENLDGGEEGPKLYEPEEEEGMAGGDWRKREKRRGQALDDDIPGLGAAEMPVPQYYITVTKSLENIPKYIGYYAIKAVALRVFDGNERKADAVASVATTGFYAGLTTLFDGLETTSFDSLTRKAVCAELGYRPEEFKPEYYLDSKNDIISKYVALKGHLHRWRLATDLLPLAGLAAKHGISAVPGLGSLHSEDALDLKPSHGGVDYGVVYAGKTGMWAYETFAIPKGGFYDIYKIFENKKDVNRPLDGNDLIGLINRMRTDQGRAMIMDKKGRNEIWPLLEHVCEKANHNQKFDLDTITYLLGHSRVHEVFRKHPDGTEMLDEQGSHIIDPKAYKRAMQAVDYVDKVGLEGIIEITRAERLKREQKHEPDESRPFAERVSRGVMNAEGALYERMLGRKSFSNEWVNRAMDEVPGTVR